MKISIFGKISRNAIAVKMFKNSTFNTNVLKNLDLSQN